MISFEGKTGLVFGIANKDSIAAAIARTLHDAGAELGFNYLPDRDPERPKNLNRLNKVIGEWDSKLVQPCDVTDDAALDDFFAKAKEVYGKIDFLVHSVAFAHAEDLKGPTLNCSREGFKYAMDVSAYSLIELTRRAAPLMTDGGSVIAMTYLGGETVIPGYNMMGVCKAALESITGYLAYDLGTKNIRVNAVSAGPIKTLAMVGIGHADKMLKLYEDFSPMKRCVSVEEVANAAAYLLSDISSGTTGEIFHVDGGFNALGGPPEDLDAGE